MDIETYSSRIQEVKTSRAIKLAWEYVTIRLASWKFNHANKLYMYHVTIRLAKIWRHIMNIILNGLM